MLRLGQASCVMGKLTVSTVSQCCEKRLRERMAAPQSSQDFEWLEAGVVSWRMMRVRVKSVFASVSRLLGSSVASRWPYVRFRYFFAGFLAQSMPHNAWFLQLAVNFHSSTFHILRQAAILSPATPANSCPSLTLSIAEPLSADFWANRFAFGISYTTHRAAKLAASFHRS